jgi:hypothetical protein
MAPGGKTDATQVEQTKKNNAGTINNNDLIDALGSSIEDIYQF